MTNPKLTTQIEASDDPAKELGSVETWSGQDVYVLRDTKGHFVTWRKAAAAEAGSAPVAVADGGRDTVEWTTDAGSDVTVDAENGALFVTLEGSDETGASVSFERQRATLTRERNTDVLDCGRQRDASGERFNAYVPIEVPKEELEQLCEGSKSDEALEYEVVETTKTSRAGGWGNREITKTKLSANKTHKELTDREAELNVKIDKEHDIPDNAEEGDVFAPEDLLEDARTADEKDQDALDEAAETGEEVIINKTTTDCNDPSKECNLDHVSRVATPDGKIENRRAHTY